MKNKYWIKFLKFKSFRAPHLVESYKIVSFESFELSHFLIGFELIHQEKYRIVMHK